MTGSEEKKVSVSKERLAELEAIEKRLQDAISIAKTSGEAATKSLIPDSDGELIARLKLERLSLEQILYE